MPNYLLLFGAFVSICLATAYAIKCYACESVYEAGCAENFEVENHFKYDCAFSAPPRFLENDLSSPNATACLKRVFKENGIWKYVRGCYFGDVNETDIWCRMDPTLTAVQNASCHVCNDENYCNGVSQEVGDSWRILTFLMVVLTSYILRLS
ncbi:uncharacterized protein Dwil_GK15445 [Drosophila willistoni]|uniref:Uncharacterized protein n=1 Tax=Drosophila willistoni TaxID=7260 RepID=B4MV67_DROWI|nr:uncharacterized protein LOC6641985 [Drosophila willistoni]EDW76412.2 uncharacterized protein Dwil_GK15445 [Drosophila willistoni]